MRKPKKTEIPDILGFYNSHYLKKLSVKNIIFSILIYVVLSIITFNILAKDNHVILGTIIGIISLISLMAAVKFLKDYLNSRKAIKRMLTGKFMVLDCMLGDISARVNDLTPLVHMATIHTIDGLPFTAENHKRQFDISEDVYNCYRENNNSHYLLVEIPEEIPKYFIIPAID